jgi:hypothetical protein
LLEADLKPADSIENRLVCLKPIENLPIELKIGLFA